MQIGVLIGSKTLGLGWNLTLASYNIVVLWKSLGTGAKLFSMKDQDIGSDNNKKSSDNISLCLLFSWFYNSGPDPDP